MKAHYFRVVAIKDNNKTYIFDSSIKAILSQDKIDTLNNPLEFKKQVFILWRNTIAKGPFPWNDLNTITIKTENAYYFYNKDAITENEHAIIELINNLHTSDLKLLANGTRWTILKQPIEILMSMAKAVQQNMQNKIAR